MTAPAAPAIAVAVDRSRSNSGFVEAKIKSDAGCLSALDY